ncbi:MAG: L,D-transpeptidase [Solirubrobacteraceae bacterium]
MAGRVVVVVLLAGVLLVAGGAGGGAAAAVVARSSSVVGVSQELVGLEQATRVFAQAGGGGVVVVVSAVRPITGERTVLPVVGQASVAGAGWLEVLLPGRPNGHSGWISAASTTETFTPWWITVRLSTRVVKVFNDGRLVRRFGAVVGAPATPTPAGRFFVEETVKLSAGYPGAPYALALSARSNALRIFDGGPGQVALHGVNNIGGVLGSAVSHGCVRLSTTAINWLAAHIAPGTPVTITP